MSTESLLIWFFLTALLISVVWLGSGWLFGKGKRFLSLARYGHAGAIYGYLKFVDGRVKYLRRVYDNEAHGFQIASILALFFGILLGEFLYKKFAPEKSFFISLSNSLFTSGQSDVSRIDKIDLQDHLNSISNDLPTIDDLEDSLNTDDPTVKYWAIGELERIGTEKALIMLDRLANTDNAGLKDAAIDAILRVRKTYKSSD